VTDQLWITCCLLDKWAELSRHVDHFSGILRACCRTGAHFCGRMQKCDAVCGRAVLSSLLDSFESGSSELVSSCLVQWRHNHLYQVPMEIICMPFWCCPFDHFYIRKLKSMSLIWCKWHILVPLSTWKTRSGDSLGQVAEQLFLMQRFIARMLCVVL